MSKTKKAVIAVAILIVLEIIVCAILSVNTGEGLKVQKASFLAADTGVAEPAVKESAETAPVLLSGIESSYEAPLSLGGTGICQFYESSTSSNQQIFIRVNSIIRGDSAEEILNAYQNNNDSVSIEELPNNALEYAAVDYEVCLVDQSAGELSPLLRMNVKSATGEPLEYDNVIYTTLSSVDVSGFKSVGQGEVVAVRSVFAIPVGCNDYVLEFGAEDGQKAIFRIQDAT